MEGEVHRVDGFLVANPRSTVSRTDCIAQQHGELRVIDQFRSRRRHEIGEP